MKYLAPLALLSLLAACSSAPRQSTGYSNRHDGSGDLIAGLREVEDGADETGRRILITGREMTIDRKEIVKGSCWDYSNAVYTRSGFPNNKASRITVFAGSKENGPYADVQLIKPGDWLYYVNHSYNGIEHSAIFVKWLDPDTRNALMLSYGGEKRNDPARYLSYDLSKVYRIVRPAEKSN